MVHKNKRLTLPRQLLNDSRFRTKIKLYFSYEDVPDGFDRYEGNLEYLNLNPKTITGYVTQVTPQALVYKQYGLHHQGAKEIVCDSKYKNWFEKCNLIEIDSKKYSVYKTAEGNRTLITERPMKMIRVVVTRNGE